MSQEKKSFRRQPFVTWNKQFKPVCGERDESNDKLIQQQKNTPGWDERDETNDELIQQQKSNYQQVIFVLYMMIIFEI